MINPVEPLTDVHDTVSVRVSYGDFSAVYTGDAETQHEADMIQRHDDLSADILHLGHHGSYTSTGPAFLEAVAPEVAIYSAGLDNQYGHPHAEVVERVTNSGIELMGTSVHGTIVVTTDGDSSEVEVEALGDVEAAAPAGEQPAAPAADPDPAPDTAAAPAGCVDINTASFDELQQIIHIGPDRAGQILDLRPFSSVDNMQRINGIGPARMDDIRAQGVACAL